MGNLNGSKPFQNLKDAFAGESMANRRYLYFARQADVEGQPDIAGLFRDTAEGETGHAHGHLEYLEVVGDPATVMTTTIPDESWLGRLFNRQAWLLFPAKVHCGQSLLDARRESIVIDHNYTHLFDLCDRINVIQQGQVTLDANLSEISLEELIERMVQSRRNELSKYLPGFQASAKTEINPQTNGGSR